MKYLILHLIVFPFLPTARHRSKSLLLSICRDNRPVAAGAAVPAGPNGTFLQKPRAFLQLCRLSCRPKAVTAPALVSGAPSEQL